MYGTQCLNKLAGDMRRSAWIQFWEDDDDDEHHEALLLKHVSSLFPGQSWIHSKHCWSFDNQHRHQHMGRRHVPAQRVPHLGQRHPSPLTVWTERDKQMEKTFIYLDRMLRNVVFPPEIPWVLSECWVLFACMTLWLKSPFSENRAYWIWTQLEGARGTTWFHPPASTSYTQISLVRSPNQDINAFAFISKRILVFIKRY